MPKHSVLKPAGRSFIRWNGNEMISRDVFAGEFTSCVQNSGVLPAPMGLTAFSPNAFLKCRKAFLPVQWPQWKANRSAMKRRVHRMVSAGTVSLAFVR